MLLDQAAIQVAKNHAVDIAAVEEEDAEAAVEETRVMTASLTTPIPGTTRTSSSRTEAKMVMANTRSHRKDGSHLLPDKEALPEAHLHHLLATATLTLLLDRVSRPTAITHSITSHRRSILHRTVTVVAMVDHRHLETTVTEQ